MRIKPRFFPLVIASLLLVQANLPIYAGSTYRVGAGDELSVNFPLQGNIGDLSKLSGNSLSIQIIGESIYWRHQVIVAPDGYISLPTLPPLQVAGLTLEQIQELINPLMKFRLRNSSVSIGLTRPNSTAFYGWGEVKSPGRFVFERPTNLMEALGVAGGATDRARLKHVMLLRPDQPPLTFDLSAKQLEQKGPPLIALQPTDTIVVPKKRTPDFNAVFLFLTAITAATGVYVASK